MRAFGGSTFFLDKDDINTDEIIPAKYLSEITKIALKQHLMEDLLIDGKPFDNTSQTFKDTSIIISRKNFGCGSSREHAVWAFEVNDINVIIAESFARIFRQNMFNCGILAIELPVTDIQELFSITEPTSIKVDVDAGVITVFSRNTDNAVKSYDFVLSDFDKGLVTTGGWLEYAESRY